MGYRRMSRLTEILERGLRPVTDAGDEIAVTLDPAFQGLPDTAHGGSVLALFDALARREGARTMRASYLKRVPLGVPLRLGIVRAPTHVACELRDGAHVRLAEGRVVAPADDERVRTTDLDGLRPDEARHPLPVSRGCFVCGIDNVLGLRARLSFDDRFVSVSWPTSEVFRTTDGVLTTIAVTALLDEAAFWLGALATGESGMTTELRVTIDGDLGRVDVLRVIGDRRRVARRSDDARYLDTALVALGDDGRLLATAGITFVTVRGAARRLADAMRNINEREVLRRVFPSYVND
jgi:hypothetical protein